MSTVRAVEILGLRELQGALRDLDKALPRELRKVNLSVAQDVAKDAQAFAIAQGGVLAKAAPAIRAGAEQRSAYVRIVADAKTPFALGAEFGAGRDSLRIGKTRTGTVRQYIGYRQFKPWRGNGPDAGYALYPTIRGSEEHIVDAYTKRLGELLTIAFPQ